jgi:23S rRNA-/tRNA-specific pseudouridylate synthase
LSDAAPGTIIELMMGHSAKSKKKMIAFHTEEMSKFKSRIRGKPRDTVTEILELLPMANEDTRYLARLQIKTGVLHQIRCVLERIGIPIVGDPIYGLKKSGDSDATLFLHSEELHLPLCSGVILQAKTLPNWVTSLRLNG